MQSRTLRVPNRHFRVNSYLKRFIFIFLLFLIAINGCCFIPIPRKAVIQPQCTFTITDEDGKAIKDCSLRLYWWEYPYKAQKKYNDYLSDYNGKIVIKQIIKKECIYPLMMHGIPFYNWTYCICKDDYITLIGSIYNVRRDDKFHIPIMLRKGKSVKICSDYDKIMRYEMSLERSDDGQLGKPKEIILESED